MAVTSDRVERAELARCLQTFTKFCALLEVVDIDTGRRMPMRLTPIQRAYCAARTPRDIVLKPRKVFMTTLEVARDLWWFLTRRGARVVIVCQSEKGNAARRTLQGMLRVLLESLRKVLGGVGSSAHGGERFDVESDTELAWHERDATLRIMEAGAAERTAHKGGRSQTVNRLHATETAFWEHGHATLNSLVNAMPASTNGSEVVLESTANGAAGYYYEQWEQATRGLNGFAPHFFPWHRQSTYRAKLAEGESVVPRDSRELGLVSRGVSLEQIKWYREKSATIGPKLASQEFPDDPLTCFLVSGQGFFDGIAVERMIRDAKPPVLTEVGEQSGSSGILANNLLVPALRVFHRPEPGREYVVGSDTSDGVGGSAGCGIVVERGSGRHMATLWGQFRPWVLAKHLAALGHYFNDATIAVERNNTGLTVLRALDVEQGYPHDLVFCDRDDKPGWNTSPASRAPMLDTLEEAVRRRAFVTDDVHLLSEMRTFVVTVTANRERPEHAKGARDDLVMGTAIAWEVACRRRRKPLDDAEWVA